MPCSLVVVLAFGSALAAGGGTGSNVHTLSCGAMTEEAEVVDGNTPTLPAVANSRYSC
jgi:hypothetical protein